MIVSFPVKGAVYKARNQGRTITPQTIEVEVVWTDDITVWYRIIGDAKIKSTAVEIFMEIVDEL